MQERGEEGRRNEGITSAVSLGALDGGGGGSCVKLDKKNVYIFLKLFIQVHYGYTGTVFFQLFPSGYDNAPVACYRC